MGLYTKKPVTIEAVLYRFGEYPSELDADVSSGRIRFLEDGSALIDTLEGTMPGAPSGDIAGAVEDILALAGGGIGSAVEAVASPAAVSDEVLPRLGAVEAAVEALKADIAAAHPATTEDPTVTQRLDAIDRAIVALQGSISKLEAAPAPAAVSTDTADAIHKRLAALEARPATVPARAAAPAARPAASA